MSNINPAPDIKYLQDNIGKGGKKNLENEEFKKRRLLNIVKKIALEDFIQAEFIKADVESYYNNYDDAIRILKNVLKLTNNQSYEAWERLLKLYVETAHVDAFIETYKLVLNQDLKDLEKLDYLLQHIVYNYITIDLYDDPQLGKKIIELHKDAVDESTRMLQLSGVSLGIYRKFMTLFYQEFYAQYDGKTRPVYHYEEHSLVIRVHTGINQAEEIFEFNNHLQDMIMAWYVEANEEDQQQIEKVVIYIKNSTLIMQEYEVAV